MHHVNLDMRMHAQIWGKKKEVRTFSPPKMPLVISCTFLGNGNTTSVPISVSFTQIRGPKERVATALYQPLQSHHYSQILDFSAQELTVRNNKKSFGTFSSLFIAFIF